MKYFKPKEFNCKCCGMNGMNYFFLSRLDVARDIAKTKFVITSGYRCLIHNKEVNGSPTSSHPEGQAADIAYNNPVECFLIVAALLQVGFKRIGISHDFIHVDDGGNKEQYVMWLY